MRRAIATTLTIMSLYAEAQPGACRVYDFAPLTQRLAASLDEVGPVGVGVSLIQDGRVVYQQTFGALTPDTQLEIASATKLLSAAVILATVDDGDLELSDTASDTTKPFPPLLRTATVAQMFSHTSGIDPEPGVNRNPTYPSIEACVEDIAALPPASAPGIAINYGGNSMQTAGFLAERKTQTPWHQIAETQILEPLGLIQTDYLASTDGQPATNPNVAGSGRSTLNEYTRLAAMLSQEGRYAGRQILSPDAVRDIFTIQPAQRVDHSPYDTYEGLIPWATTLRTGLGCFIDPPATDDAPPPRIISQGAWGASAYFSPEREIAMVFFVEQRDRVDATRPDGSTVSINPAFLTFADVVATVEAIIPTERTPASLADINKDNRLTGADFNAWLSEFTRAEPIADLNRDGAFTGADFNAFLAAFAAACS